MVKFITEKVYLMWTVKPDQARLVRWGNLKISCHPKHKMSKFAIPTPLPEKNKWKYWKEHQIKVLLKSLHLIDYTPECDKEKE